MLVLNLMITLQTFEVNQGLRQGCGLSPLLFILYLDKIIKGWKSLKPPGIKIDENTTLNTVTYADDQLKVKMTCNVQFFNYQTS
jgi:hypothetical protein